VKFTLPLPPSKNRLEGRTRAGRHFPTPEKERFLRAAELIATQVRNRSGIFAPMTCPVSVSVRVFLGNNRKDGHNVEEILFDALQGVVYENDRQVKHHECWVEVDARLPRVEVTVENLGT
jgi:Holliday junction resolvase RusA-like endonuclease